MQAGFLVEIREGTHTFVMPSEHVRAIETRDRIGTDEVAQDHEIPVLVAVPDGSAKAVRLADLIGVAADQWGGALFVEGGETLLGVLAERIRVVEKSASGAYRKFTAVGSTLPVPAFSAVWVTPEGSRLVLDPDGLKTLAS